MGPIFFYNHTGYVDKDKYMSLIDDKTNQELLDSLVEEAAKAQHELTCSKNDLVKAQSRLRFVLMVLNKLKDR